MTLAARVREPGAVGRLTADAPKDKAVPGAGRVMRLEEAIREGARLHQDGKLKAAEVRYRAVLEKVPDHPQALHLLGVAAQQSGRPGEAVELIRRAIAGQPTNAEFQRNLANVLTSQQRHEEALAPAERALALAPGDAAAHANLGNVLRALGRYDEAVAAGRRAVSLKPDFAEAHTLLGNALKATGAVDESLAAYEQAIALDPSYAGAHYNKALAQLLAGDYAAGFETYGWRWKWAGFPSTRPRLDAPIWAGEAVAAGPVMLWGEQGTGDVIQFVRYAALVKARGIRVVVACQRELHRLISAAPGVDGVCGRDARAHAGRPFAAWVPLLDLPRIFGTRLETVPAEVPYLSPSAGPVAGWRARLAGAGFKVGLVWAGNPAHRNDRNRSLPLAALAPLTAVPGVRFFALQKGPRAADAPPAGMTIDSLAPLLTDFAETAAAIDALDLVVSVDTAVAHLAGALGKPVWCLLPYAPDWRWLLGREDSPWYPTMRLFRQSAAGDWAKPVGRVAAELRRAAAAS